MSFEAGLILSFAIVTFGALGLTAFAIYAHSRQSKEHIQGRKQQFIAIIESCAETGLFIGHVPGVPGACSQGQTLDDLHTNLKKVLGILIQDGVKLERQFVGTQCISL
jgi:predicted RNase H-like HicB family nuclease